MRPYPAEIEREMKKFYQTLSEKNKRRDAAIEALKLGHGGQVYIAKVLDCHRNTVAEGMRELHTLSEESGYEPRIRKEGGGRKSWVETYPGLEEQFLQVMDEHTAGDPMNVGIRWTNLSPQAIADLLADQHEIRVSDTVIRQLLAKHHYRRRKIQKKRP